MARRFPRMKAAMLLPADQPVPADQAGPLAAQFMAHVGAVQAFDRDVIEMDYADAAADREEEAWRTFEEQAARITDTFALAADREELEDLRLENAGRPPSAAERRIEARLAKADARVEALRQKVAAELADHRAFVVRWVNQQLAAQERLQRL
jgi:hypothetical protein